MKKKVLSQLFAAALVCGSLLAVGNIPASAANTDGIKCGLKAENGNVYFYDQQTGVKETNKWSFYHIAGVQGIKDLDGWYHSDENGMMQKNVTIKDDKGNDCVLDADGKLTNREDPEFNESQDPAESVLSDSHKPIEYIRKTIDGNIYYVDSKKGEKKIGWVMDNSNGKWYYCNKDGVMQKDTTIIIDDEKYVFDTDGAWINN